MIQFCYRTNLPKEVMGFPDFPIPEQDKSYLSQAEILDFLNLYAEKFNLKSHIKVFTKFAHCKITKSEFL